MVTAVSSRTLKLFPHPLAEQGCRVYTVRLSHFFQGCSFFLRQVDRDRPSTREKGLLNLFELVGKVGQVVRIPEVGQLGDGVCLGNLLSVHFVCRRSTRYRAPYAATGVNLYTRLWRAAATISPSRKKRRTSSSR